MSDPTINDRPSRRSRTRGLPAPLDVCPAWCIDEAGDLHGDAHTTALHGVSGRAGRLYVAVAKPAAFELDEHEAWQYAEASVQLSSDSAELAQLAAPEARSLAAVLVHAADVAEGLR